MLNMLRKKLSELYGGGAVVVSGIGLSDGLVFRRETCGDGINEDKTVFLRKRFFVGIFIF